MLRHLNQIQPLSSDGEAQERSSLGVREAHEDARPLCFGLWGHR